MSTKTQDKNNGKIPAIINKNKNLSIIANKLNQSEKDIEDVKKISPVNLPEISNSIKDKILNNETIVKLFPDIELSMQIVTSSILSPNDMVSTNLIYDANDLTLPSDIKIGLLDSIKTYISNEYKIEDKLPNILRESMFTKGAYIETVIPESSVKTLINNNLDNVSVESIADSENKDRVKILSNVDKDNGENISIENLSMMKDEEQVTLNISDEELDMVITDDFSILASTEVFSKVIKDKISNELYQDHKVTNKEEEEFEKLFRTNKAVKDAGAVTVLTKDQISEETIGKPLIMKLPVESTIPVHVTGDVSNHLGYFVLLNEKGIPISTENTWEIDAKNMSQELSTKAKSLIDKASNAINGYSKKEPKLSQMEEVYSHIIKSKIKKRLKDGVFGDAVDIDDDNNDIYRVMLTRVLKKQRTKLLYIPKDLVSYFAFKYRDNGTGESLLETISVLSSIRAILLFARIMANIKNSVTTTEISATIDPNDVDPSKTMNKIMSEVMKSRQTQLPIGVTRVEDLVDWTKKVGYRFNFKHDSLPDMDISTSDDSTSKVVPDSDLDEDIRKQILMAFSLPPKAVEDGYDSDFATTIVQSNMLFTKRTMNNQDKLMSMVTEHVRRLIKNDSNIYSIIEDNIKANITHIIRHLKKKKSANIDVKNNLDKDKLAKWITSKYIDNITITLPRIEEYNDDNLKDAFDHYKDSVDDYIETFFGDEAMPDEITGMLGEKTEDFKYALKHAFLRKWMSDNNYMTDILNATNLNSEDDPIFDVYGEYEHYMDNLSKVLIPFMKRMGKKVDKSDKKIEKLEEEEEEEIEEDSSSDDTSDNGDKSEDGDDTAEDEEVTDVKNDENNTW